MTGAKFDYIYGIILQIFIVQFIMLYNKIKADEVIPYLVKNNNNLIFNYFTEKSCQKAFF